MRGAVVRAAKAILYVSRHNTVFHRVDARSCDLIVLAIVIVPASLSIIENKLEGVGSNALDPPFRTGESTVVRRNHHNTGVSCPFGPVIEVNVRR